MLGKNLEITRNAEGITIGFRRERVLDDALVETLSEIIFRDDQPEAVWFDLTGVQFVASHVLGFYVSLHKKGIRVVLLNVSDEIRSLLDLMQLDTFLEVVDGDLTEPDETIPES